MRSLRNFFHNINDILLAIIIVGLAVGIIYWRMQVIMDYPKKLAAEQASYTTEEIVPDDISTEEEPQG